MAESKPTYRYFVPSDGGYKQLEKLTPQERDAFGRQCVERMGAEFNRYFGQHPEVYAKL